ncbi:MAG: DMT family transporter [Defluviitaleaceae bacterium]|nr:DMT family transporter [Defluviitaleaceae bacterium]
MKKYKGELALLFVSLIWGTGFVSVAFALEQFHTFQILAARFILSTLIMGAIFYKKILALDKTHIKYGAALGALLISGYAFQTTGLLYTTPGKNAFIVASAVVMVPFIGTLVYRRKTDKYNVLGAFTAMVGVCVMSFAFDGYVNIGDVLTLIGTVAFAFHLFFTSEFMSRGPDVAKVVVVQFATCAVIASAAMLAFGETDFSRVQTDGVMIILFIALFNTSLCFFVQTWAQKTVNETKAIIIISMESVFAVGLSVALGFEGFTARMLLGGALILAGALVTEIRPWKRVENE